MIWNDHDGRRFYLMKSVHSVHLQCS